MPWFSIWVGVAKKEDGRILIFTSGMLFLTVVLAAQL